MPPRIPKGSNRQLVGTAVGADKIDILIKSAFDMYSVDYENLLVRIREIVKKCTLDLFLRVSNRF